jgi:dihydrofolate reductase
MIVSLVSAMTDARVIGYKNQLPWKLPADLKRFKNITIGQTIIMGRKTFESLNSRPLPGRMNLVVTRNPEEQRKKNSPLPENLKFYSSLEAALEQCKKQKLAEAFVVGGQAIFEAALPLADKLYLTIIHQEFPGDTWFPKVDLQKEFRIVEESHQHHEKSPAFDYSFIDAVRILK